MRLKSPFMKHATLFLTLITLAGCAVKRLEPWSQFMHAVIASAQAHNHDKLTRELSLYRLEEIQAFYRQASIVEVVSPENEHTNNELYNAMREDVQMFIRSYKDLFNGKPVTYSIRPFEIEGVDLFSVILWVKKDGAYRGILVHAVWQRPTDFKVLEWVYTEPSGDPRLWKKRAKLTVHDLQSCEFPTAIEFEHQFK